MSAPLTVTDFIGVVRQSGLVDEATLAAYLERHERALAQVDSPAKMAAQLVRAELLTQFQVGLLLQGRWRRFSIGRYKVLDQLGAGGMGAVYLCEHKHMRRRVAVKVLPIARAMKPSCLERFYREARAAAALNHPNIVRAYDIGQDDSLHYLAMEYVEGATLQELVDRQGPLEPLQAVHYLRQAALGLQHAYEAGLVHRDIKPGNMVVDLTGTLKILDLGLARFFADETDDVSVRHDETALGTVDYLAPEQAVNSHDVDIRADIYSLGCTMYFCLTGQTPFGDATGAQKMLWHQSRFPQPIRDFRSDVPRELLSILDTMLAKRLRDRYQTPAALLRDLEALPMLAGETKAEKGSRTQMKPSQRRPEPRQRRWPAWDGRGLELLIGGTVLVVCVGVLLWLVAGMVGKARQPAPGKAKAPTASARK